MIEKRAGDRWSVRTCVIHKRQGARLHLCVGNLREERNGSRPDGLKETAKHRGYSRKDENSEVTQAKMVRRDGSSKHGRSRWKLMRREDGTRSKK